MVDEGRGIGESWLRWPFEMGGKMQVIRDVVQLVSISLLS